MIKEVAEIKLHQLIESLKPHFIGTAIVDNEPNIIIHLSETKKIAFNYSPGDIKLTYHVIALDKHAKMDVEDARPIIHNIMEWCKSHNLWLFSVKRLDEPLLIVSDGETFWETRYDYVSDRFCLEEILIYRQQYNNSLN